MSSTSNPKQTTNNGAALLERARALFAAGRFAAARPMLNAALSLLPADAAASELHARLLLHEGSTDAALAVLDGALALAPASAPLLLCRAGARHQAGDIMGAAGDAAEAVIADRGNSFAKASLGALLCQLGQYADALACLGEAVAGEPANPGFLHMFALAQDAAGDAAGAEQTLRTGIGRAPGNLKLRVSAMALALRRDAYDDVIALVDDACGVGVADSSVFVLLGDAHAGLGNQQAAKAAYATAFKLAPDDAEIRALLQARSAPRPAGEAA